MREEAAQWVARLRSGVTEPAILASFEAWLTADPRHRVAFDEAARNYRIRSGELLDEPAGRYHWRAATLMAAAALLMLAGLLWRDRVDERHVITGKGDLRTIQLADGSDVTIDAETELDVRITPLSRSVTVQRGQALFRVAYESFRPFEVEADRIKARATGTEYAVALRPQEILVSVTEGTVDVRDEAGPSSEKLGATQLLTITRGSRIHALKRDLDARSVAWVRGKLDVDGQKLRDVIDEVNRYVDRPILISDSDIGDLPVSGVFDPRRPDNFLEALAQIRPITVERAADGSRRISRRR
ncbi:FecR family protein [Roseiterribacter gracilis]|uniref:Sensor n=1 Tax=Roseiterribacter gracilis TaxID=2812848 RepID=A0A8S8X662_9PROT|nr:sensor [Rhodospirillales bacterium TMPK1]